MAAILDALVNLMQSDCDDNHADAIDAATVQASPASAQKQKTVSLVDYMNTRKELGREKKKVIDSVSAVHEWNSVSAVRKCELRDPKNGNEVKVKGSGQYKTWTAEAMLRASFGHGYTSTSRFKANLKSPNGHAQNPGQFSTKSCAFWLSACSTHLQKVRHCVCRCAERAMEELCSKLATSRRKPRIAKVQVEFDETKQHMKIRNALLDRITGAWAVMLQRWTIVSAGGGHNMKRFQIPLAPCVLADQKAGTMLEGISIGGPFNPLTDIRKFGTIGVCSTVSDWCSTNVCVTNYMKTHKPESVVASWLDLFVGSIVPWSMPLPLFIGPVLHGSGQRPLRRGSGLLG
jgi:hypothetical protein